MAKDKGPKKQYNVDLMTPDELGALRQLVKEFMSRLESIDNEAKLLQEDRKELIEEYSEKLDMNTLKAALKVAKIQQGVKHRDTFDMFLEALVDPAA